MKTRIYVMAFLATLILLLSAQSGVSAQATIPVTVTIFRFIEIEDPDPVFQFGDYYAKVKIDGFPTQTTDYISGNPSYGVIGNWEISPYWTFTRNVDATLGTIPVQIEIWDDDDWPATPDDVMDLDPTDNETTLNLTLNLTTGNWSGDVPANQPFSQGDGDHEHFDSNEGGEAGRIFFSITLSANGDIDQDGIPDGVEMYGVYDENGNQVADMSALGADPCRKSVAIEVDYLDGAADGHSHMPTAQAIQEAVDAYNNAPLTAVANCPYAGFPTRTSGANLIVDVDDPLTEEEVFDCTDLESARLANFAHELRPYLQYNVWAHDHAKDSSSSGVACTSRQFIVSLGSWGANQNGSVREQAGTLIHELGHTLGLGHGGGDNINYKPNYLSVMSYRWQTIGLINSNTGVATIDYSREALDTLDETRLNESVGIDDGLLRTSWNDLTNTTQNGSGNQALDWTGNDFDGNGTNNDDSGVTVDINGDRVCIIAGDDGTLDSSASGDDQVVGNAIHDGADRTCNSTLSSGDEQKRAKGDVQTNLLTGYDDWENLKYRAAMAPTAGAPGPDQHKEITYEESTLIQAYWEAFIEVEAGPDQSSNEGSVVSLAPATFIDPGSTADTHTATISWGDGLSTSGIVTEAQRSGTVAGSHVYADNGSFTVTVTVCDASNDCASDSFTITISNVSPTITPVTTLSEQELDVVNLPPVHFSDSGFDCTDCVPASSEDFTATIDWGDGTPLEIGVVSETPGAPGKATVGTVTGSHVYGDNGAFTVQVSVADDDGGLETATFTVQVSNVDPEVVIDDSGATVINGMPIWITHAGSMLDFSGRATDPGSDDLTLAWDWDDGAPAPDVSRVYLVNPPNPDPLPSPSIQPRDVTDSSTHTFAEACFYQVAFLADDDDGGSTEDATSVAILGNATHIRSAGYWKQEFRQQGHFDFDVIQLQCYLDIVGSVSQVFDELTEVSTPNLAYSVLNVRSSQGMGLLDRQLLAAWLNFANGAIDYDELVDTDGDAVGDTLFHTAVFAAEAVRLDPNATSEQIEAQKDKLEWINVIDEGSL